MNVKKLSKNLPFILNNTNYIIEQLFYEYYINKFMNLYSI